MSDEKPPVREESEMQSNHTVYNVNYHFVWCPKSRKAKLCVPRGTEDPA